ncbi:MAG: hypothetical protein WD688_22785 [Candidatus Binatia bacterium]
MIYNRLPGLTGFSAFNLWRMRQLYIVHSSPGVSGTACASNAKGSSAREPKQILAQLSKNEYFIDLLFYHRFLKALVAVELKCARIT